MRPKSESQRKSSQKRNQVKDENEVFNTLQTEDISEGPDTIASKVKSKNKLDAFQARRVDNRERGPLKERS